MILNLFKIKRILVVDDIPENVELIMNYLKNIKRLIIDRTCKSKEAISMIQNKKYDLILLDIQMPFMDGYEMAMKLKSGVFGKNMDTNIIFITGIYNSDIDKIKGYNIGSIDYLTKPINREEFVEKIKYYLLQLLLLPVLLFFTINYLLKTFGSG